LAKNPADAEKLAESGEIEYAPCHEHSAVGPMAGIVSASMPVFVIKNEEFGNYSYATMTIGAGQSVALRSVQRGSDSASSLDGNRAVSIVESRD
jgi:lipid-binding SYLF domain-containing protein